MHGCFCVWLTFALLFVDAQAAESGGQPITTCAEILKLSPAEANESRPVRLRGVVTCYSPGNQLCFVQDETGGLYVMPAPWPKELAFGEVVTVQGVTSSGRFSPIVQWGSIQATGERKNLAPKTIAIEELNTGRFDAQFVRLRGVVQSMSLENRICTLQVWMGGSSARVVAFDVDSAAPELVDAEVEIDGVGGTFYSGEELSGFGVFLTGLGGIHIVTPPRNPFEASLRNAHAPLWYSKDGGLDHRVRVRGVVTVTWPGEAVFIQDKAGAIRVKTIPSGEANLRAGDEVEAAGFLRDFTGTPHLEQAVIRKIKPGTVPEPQLLTLKQLFTKNPSGIYVTTDGFVANVRHLENGLTLFELTSGNSAVTTVARRDAAVEVRAGARVRVSGAWGIAPTELKNRIGAALWLLSKASLVVIVPPREPAGAVSSTYVGILAGCTVAALLLVALIMLLARRKTLAATAQSETSLRRLGEQERELARLTEERESLGRDLHDRIIQSIYAIGLNIEDCAESTAREPSKVQARLKAALTDVNGVIAELRNVILGLETNAIQPRELRTALKSLALALGHEESNRIRLRIDEDALNAITPGQATELVHIAREAMSNSIRHGGAQTTSFSLELGKDTVTFSVEDDGKGFNPAKAEGKGFGLRNMAKRAEQLGALFSIKSEEGHGTRVVLDIPRQKQHFSSK